MVVVGGVLIRAPFHTGRATIHEDAEHVGEEFVNQMTAPILVAGIGNIFLGDAGFGPKWSAAPRCQPTIPTSTRSTTESEACISPTTCSRSRTRAGTRRRVAIVAHPAPSTCSRRTTNPRRPQLGLDAHSMDPAAVFASLRALGGTPPCTVVVGCEAGSVDEGMGLYRARRRRRAAGGRRPSRKCSSTGSNARRRRADIGRADAMYLGIPGQVVGCSTVREPARAGRRRGRAAQGQRRHVAGGDVRAR